MPSSALSSHGEKQQQQQQLVCVTGAGGFVGAWVVKELLLRGYRVSGTARVPADRKNEHLLSLEGAKERLALCRADVLDFLQLLRDLCPDYPIPTKCKDDGKPMAKPYRFSNQRLRDLGLEFTPLEESLYETVVSLQRNGHLPLHGPVPKRSRL